MSIQQPLSSFRLSWVNSTGHERRSIQSHQRKSCEGRLDRDRSGWNRDRRSTTRPRGITGNNFPLYKDRYRRLLCWTAFQYDERNCLLNNRQTKQFTRLKFRAAWLFSSTSSASPRCQNALYHLAWCTQAQSHIHTNARAHTHAHTHSEHIRWPTWLSSEDMDSFEFCVITLMLLRQSTSARASLAGHLASCTYIYPSHWIATRPNRNANPLPLMTHLLIMVKR